MPNPLLRSKFNLTVADGNANNGNGMVTKESRMRGGVRGQNHSFLFVRVDSCANSCDYGFFVYLFLRIAREFLCEFGLSL